MKKRYVIIIILLIIIGVKSVNALTIDDCQVLVSFKQNSSLDDDTYICKNKKFGNPGDSIYYSGTGSNIVLNNFNSYYFTNWDLYDVSLDLNGDNNISLLHIGDAKLTVKGTGSLKFKEDSYVKKVLNGEKVYQFIYDNKAVLYEKDKIYEGTLGQFIENYESLKELNNLPKEYKEEDYELVQVVDYVSMTSVSVTKSWIEKHINTDLETSIVSGYGIIKYVKPKEEPKEKKVTNKKVTKKKKQENSTLKSEKVILISEKKLNKKYKLNVSDLAKEKKKYKNKVENFDIISLYDVSVYNGKKEVEMKNGSYIIKIKIDGNYDLYKNYKIIYVNDKGEIAEYIDGVIEDGYIVFHTTHLSQYGVIGEEVLKEDNIKPIVKEKKNDKLKLITKIAVLVIISGILLGLIIFVTIKSELFKKKKKKRKRA